MKSEKREKERFRPGGKSKTPKNCISAWAENQNHSISTLPPRRKIKTTQFPPFRRGGKIENSKNCVSPQRESQNQPKTAFPPGGKIRISRKLRFPPEGKSESAENCVSPRGKMKTAPKGAFCKKKILILHRPIDATRSMRKGLLLNKLLGSFCWQEIIS